MGTEDPIRRGRLLRPPEPPVPYVPESDYRKMGFTLGRLTAVYDFAAEQIGSSYSHLDVGTYNGFALPRLARIANHIVSFDINGDKLQEAQRRPDIAALIADASVDLVQMDARRMGFYPEEFDSATMVEVFGAGFKGRTGEVESVFRGIHDALRPGGVLIFTIKSNPYRKMLRDGAGFHQGSIKSMGTVIDRSMLRPVLRELFPDTQWYGQFISERLEGGKGTVIPGDIMSDTINWYNEAYIPQHLRSVTRQKPLYWVAVCRKPFPDIATYAPLET